MSGPSITGGSSLSLDEVLVMLWGSKFTGASTAGGSGLRYMDSNVSTESV
jgi:hypothetical protein